MHPETVISFDDVDHFCTTKTLEAKSNESEQGPKGSYHVESKSPRVKSHQLLDSYWNYTIKYHLAKIPSDVFLTTKDWKDNRNA